MRTKEKVIEKHTVTPVQVADDDDEGYVGGLSGAFIPVSEDQGMIDAVEAGALTLEKLEAMTCVC